MSVHPIRVVLAVEPPPSFAEQAAALGLDVVPVTGMLRSYLDESEEAPGALVIGAGVASGLQLAEAFCSSNVQGKALLCTNALPGKNDEIEALCERFPNLHIAYGQTSEFALDRFIRAL